ncbi:SafA/ExsA family spore coat assembly protein [Alkalithermobacter paradoxus]|uniref:Chlorophenol reductase n=1 Tax=Alkalithermobacter paradoxus TaxID=29349 RepID=A0A1V4I922_9FIRM|nr:chlorophenol reductase precursor [[Clostridium] thermoalcaliphilum]
MKSFSRKICTLILISFFTLTSLNMVFADTVYTVVSGDSMWKIAVRYQIGLSEIINANPHIKNPDLIYPGDKLTIPNIDNVKAMEQEVIRLVNIERSKHNLPPLSHNWELSRVARYKSQDMIDKNYFSHTSPTYGSPFDMIKSFGIKFSAAGENIAYGQRSAQAVVNAWMGSEGHRRNILSSNFTQIGVGYAVNKSGVPYWTQMFIRP